MLSHAFHQQNESSNKILACFSISNDLRQYAQRSGFTIHDTLKKLEEICDEDTLYKIVIPKEKKKYFKKTLSTLGIKENFIFPDIEHVAKETIKRHLKK